MPHTRQRFDLAKTGASGWNCPMPNLRSVVIGSSSYSSLKRRSDAGSVGNSYPGRIPNSAKRRNGYPADRSSASRPSCVTMIRAAALASCAAHNGFDHRQYRITECRGDIGSVRQVHLCRRWRRRRTVLLGDDPAKCDERSGAMNRRTILEAPGLHHKIDDPLTTGDHRRMISGPLGYRESDREMHSLPRPQRVRGQAWRASG
jgi:hypothetical protein